MSTVMNTARLRGIVARYRADQGYGFIRPHGPTVNDRSSDVFFHHTALKNVRNTPVIAEGEDVTYILGVGPDGRERALEVRRASSV